MRTFLFAFIVLIFVAACTQQAQIDDLEAVRVYKAINGDVEETMRSFKGEDAKLFADVARAECPQGVGDEFTRTVLEASASTFTLYTDPEGNITCSILKPKDALPPVIKTQAEAPQQGVAVIVNGEQIMIADIQQALQQLPADTPQNDTTLNLIINDLINRKLLQQEAARIEVTEEDIALTREAILNATNLTEEQLQENLAAQNITMEEFDASVEEEAKLQKLVRERLLIDELAITEETVRTYYIENPNAFLQSEQAVMRQIFIAANSTDSQARAQRVAALMNSTDFCELVRQYSDDQQSIENCGVYVVPRGVIDPNLELAAFSTPQNQTSVVSSAGGLHFVQTLQVNPAQVVPYNQVAATLQQNLRDTIIQQRMNLYLQTLRYNAEIVSYLG